MSRADTACGHRDVVVATIEVVQSDRVCVRVRDTFARAYAAYSWEGSRRGDMAWNVVLDQLGWSIAYDIAHDTHVSSAEVELFKRIDRLRMARVRRRIEARGKDPSDPRRSQAGTSRSEGEGHEFCNSVAAAAGPPAASHLAGSGVGDPPAVACV